MPKLGELFVEINAKTGALEFSLKKAENAAKKTAESIGKRFERIGTSIGKVGNKLTMGLTLPIIGALGMSVKAAMEAEAADERLVSSLRLTGDATKRNIATFKAYAQRIQEITIYDDEAVKAEMAYGHNLGITTGQLEQATTAAIGLSAKYKLDLHSAMKLVGRASMGQTQMLMRYGIVLDKTLSPQAKFAALLKIGAGAFSLAEREAATTQGRFKQFNNQVGELMEVVGGDFMQMMKDFAKTGADLARTFMKLSPRMRHFVEYTLLLAAALGPLTKAIGATMYSVGKLAVAWEWVARAAARAGVAQRGATVLPGGGPVPGGPGGVPGTPIPTMSPMVAGLGAAGIIANVGMMGYMQAQEDKRRGLRSTTIGGLGGAGFGMGASDMTRMVEDMKALPDINRNTKRAADKVGTYR